MKKIVLSCTYFLPNISGVTVYTDILAKKFKQNNDKVSILSGRYRNDLSKNTEINGIKICRSKKLFSIGKGVFMPMFWWDSLIHVKNNDVVIANLPQIEAVWLGMWSKLFGKKFIVIHHCEFNFSGTPGNVLISLLTYPIHLLIYVMAGKIVSYTKDYANTSMFLKYFKKKTAFILPPVIVDKEDKSRQKIILKKINKRKDEKIVGFVGRIAWEKGIDDLIRAVLKINNIKLILVGPYKQVVGDKSYYKLKNLIEDNEKVVLWGPVDHGDLVNFYKIFDCLVLPSTNNLETFGIVQGEAMISNCPVVASDLPGVRVPVKMTGLGEIAKVGDSRDLAEKIKKVLKTKYNKELFDKAGKIFDIDKFTDSWQKCIN